MSTIETSSNNTSATSSDMVSQGNKSDSVQHSSSGKQQKNKKTDKRKSSQTIQFNLVSQPVQQEKKAEPKKVEPTLSTGDIYRALQQLIGDVEELYLVPPLNVAGPRTPALVKRSPFTSWLPLQYRYDYKIVSNKVAGQTSPHVLVRKQEIRFGSEVQTIDVFIEYDLMLRCFNQSTVRDYQTLVDSVFMTVNRSFGDRPRASYDVNTKLEAIAALYLYRNPNIQTSLQCICRTLSTYRPLVPGYYAIGGQNTPSFGEVPFDVTWKTERKLSEQLYVARLVDDDFADIIFPLYIPARTKKEFMKGMAKRLKAPPRIAHTIRGVDWNLDSTRRLLAQVSDSILNFMGPRIDSVPLLSPPDVLNQCIIHARARFNSPDEINSYVEGSRIAMEEGIRSPLFKRMLDLCIEIGVFDKSEQYDKMAPIRYIMCPEIAARGFCHALLMNTQRRLFGVSPENANPFCVKHMTEEERFDFVKNLFGKSPVCNGDISSMESSVTAEHMEDIEMHYVMRCCAPDESEKLLQLWTKYTRYRYHVSCREYEFYLNPMRLSGQEHTSAGNWMVNFTWINAIIFMLSGELPDLSKFRIVVEGDDSLYERDVPLMDGSHYQVDKDLFILAAESLGTIQKLQSFNNIDEASFCGIFLGPSIRELPDGTTIPEDMLKYETEFTLSKVLWKVGYDRTTAKHDKEVGFATVLSYLPRARGNRELYEALYYLGQKWQPSLRTMQSSHFRSSWFHTFYRGDVEDIPDVPQSLESYCQKHKLPTYTFPRGYVPRVLSVPNDNKYNMEVVRIDPVNPSASWEGLLNYLWPSAKTEATIADFNSECYYHAIHEYLTHTGQLPDDYTFEEFCNDRHINQAYMPKLSDTPALLLPGERVIVDSREGVEVFKKDDAGDTSRKPARNVPRLRILVKDQSMMSFDHAVLVGPKEPEPERPIGASSMWLFLVPLFASLGAFVFYLWCNVALFTTSWCGIPIYCFWKVAQQMWSHFGAKVFGDRVAGMARPLFVLAGATCLLLIAKSLLLVAVICLFCWIFWDYIGWVVWFLIRVCLSWFGVIFRLLVRIGRRWWWFGPVMAGSTLISIIVFLIRIIF